MAVTGIAFTIWKGDSRVIRFFVEDVPTLVDYEAIWLLAASEAGSPILTKTSNPANGITINTTDRFVDVQLDVADFDYTSSIGAGVYEFELTLVYDGSVPRVVGTGKLTVKDASNQYV